MVKLVLRRTRDGKLIYGIGYRFRLLYLFFAAVLALGALSYQGGDAGVPIIPVTLMIILFIAAWYQEQWVCDDRSRTITYSYGLLFLNKKRTFSFDEVEAFELGLFRKGARSMKTSIKSRAIRLYRTFSLQLVTGERIDIEILRTKQSAGRTEYAASALSAYCGIPLVQDQEEDTASSDFDD